MTATPKKQPARTPGEPVPEKQMPPQAADPEQQSHDTAAPKETPEIIEMTQQQLEDVVSGAVASALKQDRREREAKAKNRMVDTAVLPDSSDVDAAKITRAVLTKQGYVVPKPPEGMAPDERFRGR